MSIKSVLTALGLIVSLTTGAQDLIITKDAQQIKAKVTEVDIDVIRYKSWLNLEGPVYTIRKNDVNVIAYANGQTETFNATSVKQAGNSKEKHPEAAGQEQRIYLSSNKRRNTLDRSTLKRLTGIVEAHQLTITDDMEAADYILDFQFEPGKPMVKERGYLVLVKKQGDKEIGRTKEWKAHTNAFNGYNGSLTLLNKIIASGDLDDLLSKAGQ